MKSIGKFVVGAAGVVALVSAVALPGAMAITTPSSPATLVASFSGTHLLVATVHNFPAKSKINFVSTGDGVTSTAQTFTDPNGSSSVNLNAPLYFTGNVVLTASAGGRTVTHTYPKQSAMTPPATFPAPSGSPALTATIKGDHLIQARVTALTTSSPIKFNETANTSSMNTSSTVSTRTDPSGGSMVNLNVPMWFTGTVHLTVTTPDTRCDLSVDKSTTPAVPTPASTTATGTCTTSTPISSN